MWWATQVTMYRSSSIVAMIFSCVAFSFGLCGRSLFSQFLAFLQLLLFEYLRHPLQLLRQLQCFEFLFPLLHSESWQDLVSGPLGILSGALQTYICSGNNSSAGIGSIGLVVAVWLCARFLRQVQTAQSSSHVKWQRKFGLLGNHWQNINQDKFLLDLFYVHAPVKATDYHVVLFLLFQLIGIMFLIYCLSLLQNLSFWVNILIPSCVVLTLVKRMCT